MNKSKTYYEDSLLKITLLDDSIVYEAINTSENVNDMKFWHTVLKKYEGRWKSWQVVGPEKEAAWPGLEDRRANK